MAVGDFAADVAARAASHGVSLVARGEIAWLSGKGHLNPAAAAAPSEVINRLREMHSALGGRGDLLASKRPMACRVDFLLGSQTIVEVDEYQHFSSQRLATLKLYSQLPNTIDVLLYQRLCEENKTRADRYRATKEAPDFPFPGGRTAQRA